MEFNISIPELKITRKIIIYTTDTMNPKPLDLENFRSEYIVLALKKVTAITAR